mgnify:CR=1 FL=1
MLALLLLDIAVSNMLGGDISRIVQSFPNLLVLGVDGCTTVCFGLPLRAMALAYARFGVSGEPAAVRPDDERPTSNLPVQPQDIDGIALGVPINRIAADFKTTPGNLRHWMRMRQIEKSGEEKLKEEI